MLLALILLIGLCIVIYNISNHDIDEHEKVVVENVQKEE